MSNASSPSSRLNWPHPGPAALATSLSGDALYMLFLRFIAHLPYFKVASVLLLPQGISNGGLLAMALVNALACFLASRWSAGLRRVSAELPHRAVLPLLGTTGVFITMMVAGPVIASLLPRHPELAGDVTAILPGLVLMLVPTCACFFAAQFLTAARRPV